MKIACLVHTLLEADISQRVAALLTARGHSVTVIHLRREEFSSFYPWMIERFRKTGMDEKSEADGEPVDLLRRLDPDVVTTVDDIDPVYMPWVLAAKAQGIPIVVVQPGIIGEQPFSIRSLKIPLVALGRLARISQDYQTINRTLKRLGHGPLARARWDAKDLWSRFRRGTTAWGQGGGTFVAVSGAFNRDMLIRNGAPPERVRVVGQPRFDPIFDPNPAPDPEVEALRARGKRIVSFLPDASYAHLFNSEEDDRQRALLAIRGAQEFEDALIVIKPHPDEHPSRYQEMIDSGPYRGEVYRGNNLHALIRASELVVTGTSTTGLETILLNKPLVVLQTAKSSFMKEGHEYVPYVASGVALRATSAAEYRDALHALLRGSDAAARLAEGRDAFIAAHAHLPDGRATERLAALVEEAARLKQNGRNLHAPSPQG